MNIFIDTNIFLSFYHFTSDDLEELKKLGVLLSNGRVRLFLPQQVLDEFWRNRENKISDALNKLRDQRLNLQFPQFCKDYEEFETLRQLQKSYSKVHSELVQRAVEDIQGQRLKADLVIQDLFCKGSVFPTTEEIYDRAIRRMKIGNPPGKEGSLGDAINWEVLLEHIPSGEKLYFITDDKDFASSLDSSQFNGFLVAEWRRSKGSELVFYKSLSTFLRKTFQKSLWQVNWKKIWQFVTSQIAHLSRKPTQLLQDCANTRIFRQHKSMLLFRRLFQIIKFTGLLKM